MAGVSLQSVEKARRVIRGCGPLYSIRLWRHKVNCPAGAREALLGGVCSRKYETPEDIILCGFCRPEACRNW